MPLAARILLALLPPPEKLIQYALWIIVLPLILLALLFAGPVVVHERVPMALPSAVQLYVEAAKTVSGSTKTACDKQGLMVDWKPLVAIEAVRLEQDFSKATKARAEDLAGRFVERTGTTKCATGAAADGKPVHATAPTYRLRTLDEVLADLGLGAESRAKARDFLAFDLDLLRDVGTDCVPPGWTPREEAWRWPLPGRFAVTSCFGPRVDPVEGLDGFHHGLDLGAATGDTVVAARAGKVVHAGPLGLYGNVVVIDHGDGSVTRYGHLSRVAVRSSGWFREVKVEAGAVIGYAGSTGKSTGPHLHFEVRQHGEAVDPVRFY